MTDFKLYKRIFQHFAKFFKSAVLFVFQASRNKQIFRNRLSLNLLRKFARPHLRFKNLFISLRLRAHNPLENYNLLFSNFKWEYIFWKAKASRQACEYRDRVYDFLAKLPRRVSVGIGYRQTKLGRVVMPMWLRKTISFATAFLMVVSYLYIPLSNFQFSIFNFQKLGQLQPEVNEARAASIAQNIIVAWPYASSTIPNGWYRDTSLDTYFLKSIPNASTEPGTTGGADNHTHTASNDGHSQTTSHTHGAGTTPAGVTSNPTGAGSLSNAVAHTHSVPESGAVTANAISAGGTSIDSASNYPPYREVLWIYNADDGATGIPNGAIAFFSSADDIPVNWTATTTGLFFRGAPSDSDPNYSTQGADSHTHTSDHTHTQGASSAHTSGNSGTAPPNSGGEGNGTNIAASTHDHVLTYNNSSWTTGSASANVQSRGMLPPYIGLVAAQNDTGSDAVPENVIAIWKQSLTPPSNWNLCGSGQTCNIDIFDRFVMATSTANLLNTGGVTSHDHSATSHFHASNHTHTITMSTPTIQKKKTTAGVTVADGVHNHTGTMTSVSGGANTDSATITVSTNSGETRPPYYEVLFIKGITGAVVAPSVTTTDPPSTVYDQTTATLKGNISSDGGATITGRGFAYGTDSTFATVISTTTEWGSLTTGDFTADIGSLSCNTLYYVRAWAQNSAGTTTASTAGPPSFTTSACAPTVTNSTGESSVTADSARLNGEVTVLGGANTTGRGFAWGTDANLSGGDTATTTEWGDWGTTGTFYSDQSSLTCNTNYYYRAWAQNSAGTSTASSIEPFTTSACAPTVTNHTGEADVTADSATLWGNITVLGGENSTGRGFAWGTETNLSGGDTATTTNWGDYGTGAFSEGVSSLSCNTNYYYRAWAQNSAGTSTASSIEPFTTSACASYVVISGTLYSDEGQTEIQSAGKTIKVRIATSTPGVYSTTTIASTGYWMVDGGIEAPPIGVPISVWVDGDSVDAFTFTKASSTENDITGVDLYQNRIIVKHEATSATSTTIADLAVYDADDEPGDIRFTANGGALEVEAGQKLYIWPNKVFAPGGAMTLHGNASAEPDGDLAIADGATFTAGGNIQLAGSWLSSSTATFNAGSYGVTFNASTSKAINAQGAQFYNLTINGTASTTGSDFGVTNTFTVNSGKMLTIGSGTFASSSPSGTVTLNGTIDGAGTLGITNDNLGTAGTLSSRVRFDTTAGNITMPARTYGGVVEPYNSGGTDEQITMNSGTHTFSGAVQPMAEGAGDITLDGATNNPTVNIAGNIDFYGEEAGSEIIWTGTGIWTASSSIIDFTGGTFTASSTNTFILEDTTTLTSNSQSFASTTVSGALTLADEMSVSGNAMVSGTIYPQEYALKLTGGATKTLQGGGTIGNLWVDSTGDYDISGADFTVGSTTVNGTLSVGSGRTYTSTSTLTLSGTLDGTGTTTVQHSMLNSGGTLDTNVRFDATDGNITMPARVYGANVDIFGGSNTITAVGNATSTGAFIVSSGTFTAPGSTASLYIEGNFTNGGTFSANSGNVFLDGASQQILSGNMTGSDAFYNLTVANNSGGGDATNTPSVIFSNVASTTGTFTLNTNNTTVRFPVGATSTFQNIDWQASSGNEIKIRSSDTGGDPHTQWYVYTPGTETVSYVDFMDTNACGDGSGSIDASGAGNIDSGNNDCVLFTAVNPTASSTANQVFTVGPGPTQASSFRIIDNSTLATITATNDIRIAIATSTLDMEWGTSCNTPSFGGSASAKVESTVTFEGLDNSVAVIDVSTGFVAGDDLTISGLCFANFGSAGYKATGGLYVMKDGPTDQTSDADDTKSITIKGRMTLSNHDAGQESNKFYTLDVSVSEAELFNFKLTSSGEDIVVNNLEVSLTGISGVVSSDIENVYLFIDFNSNGVLDSAEVSEGGVGGAGNVNITGETGTITFSEDFTSTTSRNYILRANVSSLQSNDSININLDTSGITATGVVTSESIDSSGSTESVNHIKIIRYFGGASIGGVPQSDPQEEGGESEGGEIIGEEPGFMLPTSNSSPPGWSNYWANPTNAYVSDGNYTTDNAGGAQDFQSFTFNIPSGDQIDGIEVKLEASASGGAGGVIGVELSWDEGNSTTTSGTTTPALSESDTVYVLGGLSYKWGKSDWIDTHFSNSNFRLRIIGYPSGNIMRVDAIQVKVHHSAVGGSSGGGGDELLYKWPLWDTSLLANLLQATTTQISNLLSLFKNYF